MRLVAIIQARMGSSRLPGKVLMPLAGRPVLEHVVARARCSNAFDEVVVATTVRAVDDPLAAEAERLGVRTVRGSEDDVLERYQLASSASGADSVARITADCPLLDPDLLAAMAQRFRSERPDLLTNARVRTYPRGLDAEFFSADALALAAAEARAPDQREHVTPFLYQHPERFHIVDHLGSPDLSHHRWTLDTPEDYELLARIFTSAEPDPGLQDVLAILARHPDWTKINAHVRQKEITQT